MVKKTYIDDVIKVVFISVLHVTLKHDFCFVEIKFASPTKSQKESVSEPRIFRQLLLGYPLLKLCKFLFLLLGQLTQIPKIQRKSLHTIQYVGRI